MVMDKYVQLLGVNLFKGNKVFREYIYVEINDL
jgi:hypothetical protein